MRSQSNSGRYQTIIGPDPPAEQVSRTGARVYGALSMLLGIGIGLLAFRGAKRCRERVGPIVTPGT